VAEIGLVRGAGIQADSAAYCSGSQSERIRNRHDSCRVPPMPARFAGLSRAKRA